MQGTELIAVCGLNCGDCDIYRAGNDRTLAQKISDWYKKERNKDIPPDVIHCSGCVGDRARHWSGDCEILKCAVDEKGLRFCSECGEFPCERLTKWASKSKSYEEGLARLKAMAGKT